LERGEINEQRVAGDGGAFQDAVAHARAHEALSPSLCHSQSHYWLFATQRNCEQRLADALRRRDFTAYVPRLAIAPRRPHQSSRTMPFLPGHVLVRDEGIGLPTNYARWPVPLLPVWTATGSVLRVPPLVIAAMRAREVDGLIRYDTPVQQLTSRTALDRLFVPMRAEARVYMFPRLVQHVTLLQSGVMTRDAYLRDAA
jgi:hypothetical protein